MAASRGPRWCPKASAATNRNPQPLGQRRAAAGASTRTATGDPAYDAWLETNVVEQRQTGYAAVIVARRSGQPHRRPVARPSRASPPTAGDGLVRVSIDQNLLLAFIPLGRLPHVYAALAEVGPGTPRAPARSKTSSPAPARTPATSALTKSMNLGAALAGRRPPLRRSAGAPPLHQGQRLPQFLRPALDRRFRLLRQRPQDRRHAKSRITRCCSAAATTSRASCASASPCSPFPPAWPRRP